MVPAALVMLSALSAVFNFAALASPVRHHCRSDESNTVQTSLGTASGVSDSGSVSRFAVRYASAQRWQDSTMASTWELPNNSSDASAMPLACPQVSSSENSASTDEDCLSMVLYVPSFETNMPTMMWIHGGSFIVGSASGPGLDGATLAQATGAIVAIVQYRLGAFGFLSPSNETNLAVKDMLQALNFLQEVLPSFGGDTGKVTIAGQSSGASMVRALLATPEADSLFTSAILQSDPMDYSFLSTSAFGAINDYFITQLSCDASDTSCLDGLSTDDVLLASTDVYDNAANIEASLGSFEPMRCVMDGSLITSPLDLTDDFPSQSKSVLVSTVANEAGTAIYEAYTSFVSEDDWYGAVQATFGTSRADTITNSSYYTVPADYASNTSAYDARNQLEVLGTDQIWRCPSWTFARLWASAGGTAYVGEYAVGATYPDNEDISYCTSDGHVCHEDDIEIVFGTASNPRTNQSSLISAMQSRYKSFLSSGSPGGSWAPVAGDDTGAITLGGDADGSRADVAACDPSFWGSAVQYDYQVYDE